MEERLSERLEGRLDLGVGIRDGRWMEDGWRWMRGRGVRERVRVKERESKSWVGGRVGR